MTFIEEIQLEATKSNCDIVALLRKTLIVSHKLQLKDLENWVNCELKGYKRGDKIPDYRKCHGILKYFNPYNGWQLVIFNNVEMHNILSSRDIGDPITKVIDLYSNDNNGFFTISLPQEIIMDIWRGSDIGTFDTRLFIDKSVLLDIVEQVKNNILDWSLMLEDAGICGDGISFSQDDRNKIQGNPSIVNYTNNFYSSSDNTMIQQGSDSSVENMGIKND